ncbi:Hypothetical protein NTJ_08383 [Nesidiocoris tenuis]|uniref:Telomeric repeat-binding factor 2-interacting protein 1 n=1 Tax=Nesidiocoris tenuis TaxID=355587 RepID=A0ABN7AYI4_9HEMI|nr:Hypothetical protein NTJ_08383 [Nesidiocoris tenuis]
MIAESSYFLPDNGMPIFISRDGKPINFRIVGNPTMKGRYRRLITNFGGAVSKNSGMPRLNIVVDGMPCEEGHQGCSEHPAFEGEPLFKALWVDHCITHKELLNVSFYLMNQTPEFTRMNFPEKLETGYYSPASLPLKRKVLNSTPTYRVLNIKSNRITPAINAELRTIGSFGKRKSNDPVQTASSHCSAFPGEREKENRPRCNAPISSSTPVMSAIGRSNLSPKRHKERASRQCLSPLERTMDAEPSSCHQGDEPIQDNAQLERQPSPKTVPDPLVDDHNSDDSDSHLGRLDVPLLNPNQATRNDPSPGPSRDTIPSRPQNRPVFLGITYGSDSDASAAPPRKATDTKKAITQKADSSESDEEFGPPPGAVVRLKGVSQKTRASYSHNEEVTILKYILASKKLDGLRSNVVWKQMDGKPGVEKRSWQSLRNHFLKAMLPKLEMFNLTKEQINRMRRTS